MHQIMIKTDTVLKRKKKIAEEEDTEQSVSRTPQPFLVLDVHPSGQPVHPTQCTLKQEQPHSSLGTGQGQGTSSLLLNGALLFLQNLS